MGMFKRNGVYHARIKNRVGVWVCQTLNTSHKDVARLKHHELELRTADPTYQAAYETTVTVAADEFLTSREVKGCAAGTLHMYRIKLGHIKRLLGPELPLLQLLAPQVDRFTATRLREGASRNTIQKEHVSLRGMLKVAKRAGKYPHDIDAVMPIDWSSDYEPRKTALTPEQVDALVQHLARPRTWTDKRGRTYERDPGPNKSMLVAFIVATGARWSEALRAERGHIDMAQGWVWFRISKTAKSGKREKYVPITGLTRPLLEQVLAAVQGKVLFDKWANVIRDLRIACEFLGIPVVTPNDLRRTHSNWLRDAGVDTSTIAEVLGHVDGRMCERVYGRLRPEQLRKRVLAHLNGDDASTVH